jgi:glycosyltransferase involved in cell wall biosynthesis
MKIYIIDIIGTRTGMHFYNKSLRDILLKEYDEIQIISNYNDPDNGAICTFDNFYEGTFFSKLIKLLRSLSRYYNFIIKNRKNCFIVLSYGNIYEILFLLPLVFCRRVILDIHEVISLISVSSIQQKIRGCYSKIIFSCFIKNAIIHSERSQLLLNNAGYKKNRLFIPHFSLDSIQIGAKGMIPDEVKTLVNENKLNILFFGFMRLSKGIDIVVSTAKIAEDSGYSENINFIIAGLDSDGLVKPIIEKYSKCPLQTVSLLLRTIKDEELEYLFTEADYIFLPYIQISQSGVFEMSVSFRKPVITSPLPYFINLLKKFPSFGIISETNSAEGYLEVFRNILSGGNKMDNGFFFDSDLEKFSAYKNPEPLLKFLEDVLLP